MRNLLVLSLIALTACGVRDSKPLSELDQEEAQSLCEEVEERTVSCGDDSFNIEITVGGDCDAEFTAPPASCTATAGDQRACFEGYADLSDQAICDGELPAACEALFDESCVAG